jgi:hypothetical protein
MDYFQGLFSQSTPSEWEQAFEHNAVTHALKAVWNGASLIPVPENPAYDEIAVETAYASGAPQPCEVVSRGVYQR